MKITKVKTEASKEKKVKHKIIQKQTKVKQANLSKNVVNSKIDLKTVSKKKPKTAPKQEVYGLEKWVQEYNEKVLGMKELREKNINFLTLFQRREEEIKKKEKNQADDDGWVTVTKKGRNPGLSRKESVDNKLAGKTMEMKGLTNFYRFQMKESRMKHMENLRKQFEADKAKVDTLRQTRKFKPY